MILLFYLQVHLEQCLLNAFKQRLINPRNNFVNLQNITPHLNCKMKGIVQVLFWFLLRALF